MDNNQTVYNGSYATKNEHQLNGTFRQGALDSLEAAASRFATDVIKDNATRAKYAAHVKQLSNQVKVEVANSTMTVQEGATYANQLRDQIFVEYRKYTSSQGVALAEKLKLRSRGFDYYLNKCAQAQFSKPFAALSDDEKSIIYYTIIESSGRDSAKVTTRIRKLQVGAKIAILVTAIYAASEIIGAKDMIGGAAAGMTVSFACGPAEPLCAIALMYIGTDLGQVAGQAANDAYQDELDEFRRWTAK